MSKVYVIGIRFLIELTKISVAKGWSDQEVNAQIDKLGIYYKAKFSQRYHAYLVDLKCNITYQNIRGKTKFRPIFIP